MASTESAATVTGTASAQPAETVSHIDWAASLAGAALATAISLVLLPFGVAVGLSMSSPFVGQGSSDTAYAVVIGLWLLWVIVSSFLAGGYLTGRLRRRAWDATEHERDIRDGAHGLTVWAVSVMLAALIGFSGISGILHGGSGIVGTAASTASTKNDAEEPFAYAIDSLFRKTDTSVGKETAEVDRGVISRILVRGVGRGEIATSDKAYLGQLVANHTALDPSAAERRVDEMFASIRQTAETARKGGILIGFLTAAALLIGAAGAWWGASIGGQHRDERTDFSRFTRWR